jgi:hypothetical protein
LFSRNCFEIGVERAFKVGGLDAILKAQRFAKAVTFGQLYVQESLTVVTCDVEDTCVKEAVAAIKDRVKAIFPNLINPIGIVLFSREYETMFLANIGELIERCPEKFIEGVTAGSINISARDAKGELSRVMRDTTYKPTRDQASLTSFVQVEPWRVRYRPLDHLVNVLDWGRKWSGDSFFYCPTRCK